MTTIKLRRGTQSGWDAANPVLADGEQGYNKTTGETKTGDGATAFADLPTDFSGTFTKNGLGFLKDVRSIDGVQAALDSNDSAALAQAIHDYLDAPGELLNGLYFPEGTYKAALRIRTPNITIAGTWRAELTTPDGAATLDDDCPLRIFADGVRVEGVTLNGNSANNGTIDNFTDGRQADGVAIYADDVQVVGCRVKDTIGHGIIAWSEEFTGEVSAGARKRLLVHGNNVSDLRHRSGIDIASTDSDPSGPLVCHDITISGNFVRGHGGALASDSDNGITLHTAERVTISGNHVIDAWRGLNLHTDTKNVDVEGNHITASRLYSLRIGDSEDMWIDGNHFVSPVSTGDIVHLDVDVSFIDSRRIRFGENFGGGWEDSTPRGLLGSKPFFVHASAMMPVNGSPSQSTIEPSRGFMWELPGGTTSAAVGGALGVEYERFTFDVYLLWSSPTGNTADSWDAEVRIQRIEPGKSVRNGEVVLTGTLTGSDSTGEEPQRALIGSVDMVTTHKSQYTATARRPSPDTDALADAVGIVGIEFVEQAPA